MRCATQGLRARGLSPTAVDSRRPLRIGQGSRPTPSHACHFRSFCLPLVTIRCALGGVASEPRSRALRLVEQLDLRHADPMIRKQFLAGSRAEHPNEVVVPMLWALTSRPPVNEGDGFLALLEVFRREPRVRSAALVLRMLERQPGHCVGLRHWPVNRLAEWHPISERLEQLCGRLLLGHGADLRLLNRLRELRLDAP